MRIPAFSQYIGVHGGAKASGVRRCGRSGCGTVSARVWNVARVIGGIAFLSNFGVCSYIGGSNCRALDALSGGFRGCGKESNARHIVGECNCRLLDALAGEFNQQVAHT